VIANVPTVSEPFGRVVVAVNCVGEAVTTVRASPFSPVNVANPEPLTTEPTDRPFGAVTVTVPLEITTAVETGAKGLKVPHVP
jgi:hypothetical protein